MENNHKTASEKNEKQKDSEYATILNTLSQNMIRYFQGDPKRTQHFIKVHGFAKLIGEAEELDANTLFILETAAIIHDIGIRPAEETFGSCSGKLQEQEGEAPAREILAGLSLSAPMVERIIYLVVHHHTYTGVEGMDYRILLEADCLVNLYETSTGTYAAKQALDFIFQTETGRYLCQTMYELS